MSVNELQYSCFKPAAAHLANLQTIAPQKLRMLSSTPAAVCDRSEAPGHPASREISDAPARYHPIRNNWAMPRASLRSVFMIIAERAAFTFQQNNIKANLRQAFIQPLRQRACFKANPLHSKLQQNKVFDSCIWIARYLRLADNFARSIHQTHAARFQRNINSGKVLHGCSSLDVWGRPARTPSQHRHSEGQSPIWLHSRKRRPVTASSIRLADFIRCPLIPDAPLIEPFGRQRCLLK